MPPLHFPSAILNAGHSEWEGRPPGPLTTQPHLAPSPPPQTPQLELTLLYRKLHWIDIGTANETRERIRRLEGCEVWTPGDDVLDFEIHAPFDSAWQGLLLHKVIQKTGLWNWFTSTVFQPSEDTDYVNPAIYRASLFQDWNTKKLVGSIRLPALEVQKDNNTLRSIIRLFFTPKRGQAASIFVLLKYTFPSPPNSENSGSQSISLPIPETSPSQLPSQIADHTSTSELSPAPSSLPDKGLPSSPPVLPTRLEAPAPPLGNSAQQSIGQFQVHNDKHNEAERPRPLAGAAREQDGIIGATGKSAEPGDISGPVKVFFLLFS